MAYTPRGQAWVDGPAAGNAIDAEDLNRLEANGADANTRLGAIETLGPLATDAEVAAAVAAHAAAANPHTVYLLTSAAPELIRDTIGTALVQGTGVTITVNDAGDTITIAAATDPEVVRDTIAAALVPGTNVTITPDDTANTITIAATGGGGSGIPATTVDAKGDLIAATAADTVARLPVGSNLTFLRAASAQATGLEWADFSDAMVADAGPFMNAMGIRHTIYINATTGVWPNSGARTVPAGFTGNVIWDSMSYPGATAPAGIIDGDIWDQRAP